VPSVNRVGYMGACDQVSLVSQTVCWGLITYHEEEDNDEHADACNTADRAYGGGATNGADSVDDEEEVRLENRRETGSDEAADGESDQGIRQHLGALCVGDTTVLMGVVDEESGASDLGTDVAELGDEAEDHVVLLPDGTGTDDLSVGISGKLESGVVSDGSTALDARGLSDFGELGEEEHDTNGDTEESDSEVDILDGLEAVSVRAAEEVLAGNQGADEGGNAVPGLAELETSRSPGWVSDDNGVGVGGGLKGSKTAGDDQSASKEATERGSCVLGGCEVSSRPEEDGTKRVEAETHDDSDLVTLALEDLSGDGREDEVTATEVHDLQTSRFEPCDAEDVLEMLVQDIKKTVRETPEEEQRGNKAEREDEPLASEEATLNRGNVHRNSTATHCVG
jgi:hypothetical protein